MSLAGFQVGKNSFNPSGDVKLLIDVMEMGFDRVERDAQMVGNFLIALAGCGIGQNLSFPFGEQRETGR